MFAQSIDTAANQFDALSMDQVTSKCGKLFK
jgi:hypothetical protein